MLFNKPFNVLSQFRDPGGAACLADFISLKNVYPAGRLDKDSEGLLLLTDDGRLQQAIANPRFKMGKTYWAQVEGEISEEALCALRQGIELNDGPTLPALARKIPQPDLWSRNPPIRQRQAIPTSWVELTIREGRNRQVRRMTAATGFPTLRLVRHQIGPWSVEGLQPGEHRVLELRPEQFPSLSHGYK